ncbi:hypothetical protein [Peribacillus simplex]|uniref:hypothetical protein n=1 Tax=Peribacillus simplex TaxID=1478 RepID=UPI00367247C3
MGSNAPNRRNSIDGFLSIFILCDAALIFALHGWLTGALVKEELIDFKIEIIF